MWNFPFFGKKIQQKPHLIIIDGDQPLPGLFRAYKHYKPTIDLAEVHFVNCCSLPKLLKSYPEINGICLNMFSKGKEVSDKFISILIQSAITKGYNEITVISGDYDFIDIFGMCNIVNCNNKVKFTLVIPKAFGRLNQLESTDNIMVIKYK